MRRYAIDSQYNTRDIGGYPTEDGSSLVWGAVIRSDCPMDVSAKGALEFEALNISDVIDLRTSEQIVREPSYFRDRDSVHYHNITFINGNESPESEESIPITYLKMMEEQETIRGILQVIAEAQGTVLYHCAVGKDRTGIVTAIIMKICGVSVEDIIADYQVSETYIYNLMADFRSSHPHLPEWIGRSRPEYMGECLRNLDHKYGSFDHYLEAMKIPESVLQGIRKKLLTSSSKVID